MSTEPPPDRGTEPAVRQQTDAEDAAQERSDLEEDGRRQRALDDGELGGEA